MNFPCENANHWSAIIAFCWLLHSLFEYYLGKTDKVKSSSTIELIATGLAAIFIWYWKKKNGIVDKGPEDKV